MSRSSFALSVLAVICFLFFSGLNQNSFAAVNETISSSQTRNIDLGTSATSTITINNGGTLTGNVNMDNSSQTTTFNGGTLNGTIDGAGKVFIAAITILNGNIGSSTNITSLTINDYNILDLATNNKTIGASGAVVVSNNATLLVGTGTVSASIQGASDNIGTVTFNANNSLGGNVGTPTTSLYSVEIASGTITTNSRNIDALRIAINDNGVLNYGSGTITGSVEGKSAGVGSFIFNNTKTTAFSIGQNGNSLSNISILDGVTATIGDNISATTINIGNGISGTLKSNGKNITATNIKLAKGATLNISSGSVITGEVNSINDGDGIVQFSGGVVTQANSLGVAKRLDQILVSNQSTLNINNNIILNANNIIIGEGSTSTIGTPTLNLNNGAIGANDNSLVKINTDSVLNYNGGTINGTVRGTSSGKGTFNINHDYSNNFEIGKSYDLANLNISSGNTLTANANISANNIVVAGTLNLGNSSKTITGNLASSGSGGMIDLDTANHIVAGNFALHNGDSLKINALNNSSIGSLSASGSAVVESGANLKLTFDPNNGYLSNGLKIPVVAGGNGSNINAISDSNIDVNDSGSNQYSLVTFKTEAVGNNLVLNVQRKGVENFSKSQSVAQVYNAIDQVGSKAMAELREFQKAIDNTATSDNKRESLLKSAIPQNNQDLNNSALSSAGASIGVVDNRLQNILFQPTSQRIGSFANYGQARAFTNLVGQNNVIDLKSLNLANLNNQIFDSQAVWMQAFGGSARQNDVGDTSGYNYANYGLAIGADQEIAKDLRLGISSSFSIANADSKSANKQTTNIKSYQFNLYGGYNFSPYFVSGILGVAINQYHSNRSMPDMNLNASANYGGQTYIAKFAGGMTKELLSGFALTPKISLTMARNQIATYSESGAGTLNLQVSNANSNILEGRLGSDLNYNNFTIHSMSIKPKVKFSYGYDFIGGNQSAKNNFVGQDSSFTITTPNTNRASLKYGLGLDIYQKDGILFAFDYDVEQKSSYKSNSGSFYGRYDF